MFFVLRISSIPNHSLKITHIFCVVQLCKSLAVAWPLCVAYARLLSKVVELSGWRMSGLNAGVEHADA